MCYLIAKKINDIGCLALQTAHCKIADKTGERDSSLCQAGKLLNKTSAAETFPQNIDETHCTSRLQA